MACWCTATQKGSLEETAPQPHVCPWLQNIINWWHRKATVPTQVADMGTAVVTATVDIYNAIRRALLPTPAKSHYTYNMRDLSKVFQGIAMIGTPVDSPEKMAR